MRFLWRWAKRIIALVLVLILGLLAPVIYVEIACRGDVLTSDYTPVLPDEDHRLESRTLLTYPEWHIVHAYDDYAEVIATGDPHEFGFLRAITSYWTSLCAFSEMAGQHGGADFETRQMVYVIGVSFTAELLMKAAYEETIGRAFTWLRGGERDPLDDLSAGQARGYAAFLQQVPWYNWDFESDAAALELAATPSLRSRERAFALGVENRVKAAYASVIANAVAGVGFDELRLRMIVTGLTEQELTDLAGIEVVGTQAGGIVIETPRYRELTGMMADLAAQGVEFVEIAGNDDIMFTAISPNLVAQDAFLSFPRQGYDDYRHLIMVPVQSLAERLRGLDAVGLRLEHIHDY